jgi:hypothetical protein
MMSQARFNQVMSGMTTIAKKVFDAVPIEDSWTGTQIASEMIRRGVNVEFKILIGCLDTLLKAGLINEPRKGCFRREAIREIIKTTTPKEIDMQSAVKAAPKAVPQPQQEPMDRLGELAQRVAQIAGMLKDVASEISDAAVDIQTKMEASEEATHKMKQLQELLSSIGTVKA